MFKFDYSSDYWEFENGISVEGDVSKIFPEILTGYFWVKMVSQHAPSKKISPAELTRVLAPKPGKWELGKGNPGPFTGWETAEEDKKGKKENRRGGAVLFFLRAILNCRAVRVPLCIDYIA